MNANLSRQAKAHQLAIAKTRQLQSAIHLALQQESSYCCRATTRNFHNTLASDLSLLPGASQRVVK